MDTPPDTAKSLRDEVRRLRARLSALEDLIETAPLCIYFKDAESRFTAMNRASAANLGVPDGVGAVGTSDADYFDAELAGEYRADEQRILSTGKPLAEKLERQPRHDGTERWFLSTKLPLRNEDGQPCGIAGFSMDVTDRIRAEERLRKSEERYRRLFERNVAGVFRSAPDGRLLDCNDAYAQILGYASREEILRQSAWDFYFDPAERTDFIERLRQVGSLKNHEMRMRRKDGEAVWVLDNFSLLRDEHGQEILEGTTIEITDRVLAEAELRRRAGEFVALFESARDLATQEDIGAAARLIVERAMDLLGVASCGMYLFDPERQELKMAFTKGNPVPVGMRAALGEGLTGQVAQARRAIIVDDYQSWPGRLPDYAATGARAILEAPMLSGGELIGTLGVMDFDGTRRFTDDDARLLMLFASLAAGALRHSRLLDQARRRAEQLAASEERLRSILDNTSAMVFLLDRCQRFLFVNRRWERLFGRARDQVAGKSLFDVLPRGLAQAHAASNQAVFSTGRPVEQEETFLHGDDPRTYLSLKFPLFDAGGAVEALCVLSTDITERKLAEETLRASEGRYRTLFERNLAGVLRNRLDGSILELNDAFARILGYSSRAELEQRNVAEFYFDPTERNAMLRRLRAERSLSNHEIRFRRKDGSPAWVLANIVLLEDERDGAAVQGTIIDITEAKRLEESLRQAQKMEAIGQLAGGVAHDFNNLLTTILGYADLALSALPPHAPLKEELCEIRRAGERAASLTQQLLAFGRKQVAAPMALNLNAVVGQVGDMLRRLLGEAVTLAVQLDPELALTWADPGQIEQILVNLALNARDAMPQGGTLTLSTRNVELTLAQAAARGDLAPGAYVALAAADTGCGMDEETLARAFEPFFTTKPVGKGTGLGLSTVYGIAKQSGGHAEAESSPGRGAVFTILLPRTHERTARPSASAEPAKKPRGGQETVLLVEDEARVRKLTKLSLEKLGYSVLAASDGERALALCREHKGPIHLLLCDVVMPGLNGRQVAELLRALRPELKILHMSGYPDDAVLRLGVEQAKTPFLCKPFNADRLAAKVREALEG